jgi:hypothetical protein
MVWINPFHSEQATIDSGLAPAECLDRLGHAVVSRYSVRTWFFAREDAPVIGRVSGTTFWMQRIHTFVRPWTLLQASGVVRPRGSGTVIEVRVAMKSSNAILHLFLGAMLVLAALAAAILTTQRSVSPWLGLLWLLWPLASLVAYALDRVWWAGDAVYLRAYISDVVARPQPAWRPYVSIERP